MTNRRNAAVRADLERRRTAPIVTPPRPALNIEAVARRVCENHIERRIREPETFRLRKTDDERVVALALAKHVYGRYKVPYHLERIWYSQWRVTPPEDVEDVYERRRLMGRAVRNDSEVLTTNERKRRVAWYVCATSGGSLHKEHCKEFFTKKETHAFMTAPGRLTFVEALWYAVASSYTDDHGLRQRIMRSKVARPEVTPFWKDAARFFIEHNTPIHEINDYADFLANRVGLDRNYTLRGRTIQSLARARADWHRTLSRIKHHGGGSWEGVAVPDYIPNTLIESYLPPLAKQIELVHQMRSEQRITIRQLRTGDELAEEGSEMHHCVYSYKYQCEAGSASIWSMRRGDKRLLTIEMNNQGDLVQIRGFGNRLATNDEMAIIRRWANDAGLTVGNRGW